MVRTQFEASIEKRAAVKNSEANGEVADNMDVRRALMAKVHSGEITLQDTQSQLKKIQNQAKKKGQVTRAQAFSRG